MIYITIVREKQNIVTIEATGHSGYAEAGSDIICSAISVLTENCIGGLKEIVKINPIYKIDESIPHLSVGLPKGLSVSVMHDVQILMQSTYLGIKQVADNYNKFIKIKEIQQ